MGDAGRGWNWPLLVATLAVQAAVAWVPLSLWHRMGHRFAYSIRVYGWTGEVVMVLLTVGIPSVAVWQGYFAARRQDTPLRKARVFLWRLLPLVLAVPFSILLVEMTGIR